MDTLGDRVYLSIQAVAGWTCGASGGRAISGNGDIVVFAPHPDDEVIACGGTILNRVATGARVHIVFSTDGSQSHNAVLGIAHDPEPSELAAIRQGEAIEAAAALGVPSDRVTFVGARDTRLVESLGQLREVVDRVIATLPHLEEVYVPHSRRELNVDHSWTGRIVLERLAAGDVRPRIFQYVVWDAAVEADFGYTNRGEDRDVPDTTEVLYREDIANQLDAKYAAMLKHRTQTTLFSPSQTRTVVPPSLLEKVRTNPFEEFWVHDNAS